MPAPTACRATSRTSWSARCARPSTAMGEQPPGLRLACRNVVPHARGLGSSSAAIVAGVVPGARRSSPGGKLLIATRRSSTSPPTSRATRQRRARRSTAGSSISGREDGHLYAVRAGVDPRVSAVVFVPPTGVERGRARAAARRVPHADAAANAGRAALLVAALAGQPEHLLAATRDWLHQEQREPAMPETLALVRRLRAEGVPAVVSGAGPTVLAFSDGSDTVRPAVAVPARVDRRTTSRSTSTAPASPEAGA